MCKEGLINPIKPKFGKARLYFAPVERFYARPVGMAFTLIEIRSLQAESLLEEEKDSLYFGNFLIFCCSGCVIGFHQTAKGGVLECGCLSEVRCECVCIASSSTPWDSTH